MTAGRQAQARRRAAAGGASLLLHVAVLSWLGLQVLRPASREAPAEAPPLTLELLRTLPGANAPAASARAPAATASPPAATIPLAAVRPRPRQPRPAPADAPRQTPLPLPPAPSPAPPSAGAPTPRPPAPPARPTLGPAPTAAASDLRGLLRATVGCSHEEYLKLTPAERLRCDQGFATARKDAPAIPLPVDKLAEYSRQADANARKLGRREGALPNTLPPCDPGMVGSNLGMSCLPADAMHTVKRF